MSHLYWSIVILALGSCIGSFLNVVIYRWPRDLSIRDPSRSFCPACQQLISWYDNVPVISYLLLGGRCRRCAAPISLQYPLVELATAVVFLMTYDAFFVARQRIGIGDLAADWPMLIAHCVLWAGLIALAVMDLEAYLVDIRITWAVALAGLIGHMLWTPAVPAGWIRPGPEQGVFAVAVALGLALGAWVFLRRPGEPVPDAEPPAEEPPPEQIATPPGEVPGAFRWLWLIPPIILLAVYVAVMLAAGEQASLVPSWMDLGYMVRPGQGAAQGIDAGAIRLAAALAVVFVGLALAASRPQPQADSDIVDAITEEAADSRRKALQELKLLTPAIVLGVAAMALLITRPAASERVYDWLNWLPVGTWRPLWGLATAVTGWVLGGAVGWLARIGFTLLFGKEALGMGDVHILAAAGAVAGWPVAFLGFFLAAPLTLLAILVIRLRRQSRALPYGPWLGLAFFLVAMFQDRILLYLGVRGLLA